MMQFGGWGVGEAVVRKKNCKEMAMDEFVVNKGLRHGNSDLTQGEMQVLFEQLRQKDAQILLAQKKLSHFRSWMDSLQSKVNAQNSQAVKNARRLYIGGFSPGSSEEELRQFLSKLMKHTGGCVQAGNPVLSMKMMKDKNYAFAEFRSVEEAANATAFDGVAYKDTYLKVKRPSNYDVNSAVLLGPVTPDPTMDTSGLDICRSTVEDSPNKLFIGGLPYENSEEEVRDLLASFGALKSFNLVMDRNTGKSKGYAFCELVDGSLTDHVIQQLNCRKIGNKSLTVKRAAEGTKSSSPLLTTMLGSPPPAQNYPLQVKNTPNYGMAAMSSFGFTYPPVHSRASGSLGISGMMPISKSTMRNIPAAQGGARQALQQVGVHCQDMADAISQPMIPAGHGNSGMDGAGVASPKAQSIGDGQLSSMVVPNSPTIPSNSSGFHLNQDMGAISELGMFGNLPPASGLQGGCTLLNTGTDTGGMPCMMGGMEMTDESLSVFRRYPSIIRQGIHNHGSAVLGRGEHEFGMARLSALW